MLRIAPCLVALWAVLTSPCPSAAAADWPQWRGPERDGSFTFDAPDKWPSALAKRWEVTVGEGHASPIVVGKTVFLFARQGDDEVLWALDLADGGRKFRQSYAAPYKINNAARNHGKGPKSTPAASGGRVVTLGIGGILSCFNAGDGSLAWRHDFTGKFRATSPLYGTAASPLIHQGLCIAYVGGHNSGELAAFDLKSGRKKWSYDGNGPGYSSPIVARLAGREQVITQSQSACLAVSADEGKLLWHVPFTTAYDQNSVTPVVAEGRVIFGGYAEATMALELVAGGGRLSARKEWMNPQAPCYMSTPVLSGKNLFGMTHRNRGQLFCADAATGKIHWRGKPRLGDNAALLTAGDAVFGLTTGAELVVLKNSRESYEELGRYKVADSPTWAHPAIVGDNILVKDKTKLICWGLTQR